MDYDARNAFVSYVTYDVPGGSRLKPLTNGCQVNSLITFHSGQHYTVYTGNDTSGTGEGEDRVNLVPGVSPYKGAGKNVVAGQVQWITSGAFVEPSTPSFGTMRRNQLTAPGYGAVDLSLKKQQIRPPRPYLQYSVSRRDVQSLQPRQLRSAG
jgi:hypothetical protein